mmetsp:Transcript_54422/g.168519  ORF Transcript_54422/g.168519 Transcript_54422/m.168519 type:complete len:220 (-) Transcript_54422:950-1609(-)
MGSLQSRVHRGPKPLGRGRRPLVLQALGGPHAGPRSRARLQGQGSHVGAREVLGIGRGLQQHEVLQGAGHAVLHEAPRLGVLQGRVPRRRPRPRGRGRPPVGVQGPRGPHSRCPQRLGRGGRLGRGEVRGAIRELPGVQVLHGGGDAVLQQDPGLGHVPAPLHRRAPAHGQGAQHLELQRAGRPHAGPSPRLAGGADRALGGDAVLGRRGQLQPDDVLQ